MGGASLCVRCDCECDCGRKARQQQQVAEASVWICNAADLVEVQLDPVRIDDKGRHAGTFVDLR